jgi:hypothetical protein
MPKIHGKLTQLATLVSIAIAFQGLFCAIAQAVPALYFTYERVNYDRAACLSKAKSALGAEGLTTPDNEQSFGNAAFISGANSKSTAIVDCSEISPEGGRLTVMTANDDFNEASDLANKLINRLNLLQK